MCCCRNFTGHTCGPCRGGAVAVGPSLSIPFDLNKIADTEGIVPKPIGFAPAWSPKHFIFVAYVYDLATREILRVIEQPLEE